MVPWLNGRRLGSNYRTNESYSHTIHAIAIDHTAMQPSAIGRFNLLSDEPMLEDTR